MLSTLELSGKKKIYVKETKGSEKSVSYPSIIRDLELWIGLYRKLNYILIGKIKYLLDSEGVRYLNGMK